MSAAARVRAGVVLLIVLGCRHGDAVAADLKDGDLVFQTSRSAQSLAIQRATGSQYSHMGLVLFRDGAPYVFEAVATVRYTPFAEWARRGVGGKLVVKRLKSAVLSRTPEALEHVRREARAFEGKPYDPTFEWSDTRVYCSELVWKIYDRALGLNIGRLQKLRDFNLKDAVVKAKLRERYGAAIPLDETVISPSEMFASQLLDVVDQGEVRAPKRPTSQETWIAPERAPKDCGWFNTADPKQWSPQEKVSAEKECRIVEELRAYVTPRQSCARDADCVVVDADCPFGCMGLPVNVSQADAVLRKQVELRKKLDGECRYKCRPVAKTVCEAGWCVASW